MRSTIFKAIALMAISSVVIYAFATTALAAQPVRLNLVPPPLNPAYGVNHPILTLAKPANAKSAAPVSATPGKPAQTGKSPANASGSKSRKSAMKLVAARSSSKAASKSRATSPASEGKSVTAKRDRDIRVFNRSSELKARHNYRHRNHWALLSKRAAISEKSKAATAAASRKAITGKNERGRMTSSMSNGTTSKKPVTGKKPVASKKPVVSKQGGNAKTAAYKSSRPVLRLDRWHWSRRFYDRGFCGDDTYSRGNYLQGYGYCRSRGYEDGGCSGDVGYNDNGAHSIEMD